MTQILDRGGRVARRLIDWIRWHGTTRTVLRGPAAGLRISTGNSSANYAEGTNELPVQHAVEELLRPGDTFFDIGANVGFFSLLAARRVGTHGKVVAFEVVPEIATTLEANARLNEFAHLDVRTLAIGSGAGRATLRLTNHPGGATIADDADATEVTTSFEVDVVSIDQLLEKGELPVPDLVKIDVEGHERECLLGMAGLLAGRSPALIVELDAATGEGIARKRADIEALLLRFGYAIEPMPPSYVGTDWHVLHLVATKG
ncbi:MAG TPA: FkbM family methyltransferase [Ilumatobacter sp.]|nr:FkbM family methyltransferase [Ilumatobacter sp.]